MAEKGDTCQYCMCWRVGGHVKTEEQQNKDKVIHQHKEKQEKI